MGNLDTFVPLVGRFARPIGNAMNGRNRKRTLVWVSIRIFAWSDVG
jgi:hypothetical protein